MTKYRNPWAYDLAKRGRKGGPHIDRKKEQDRKACRMPIDDLEGEFDYEPCNCDQALHLKQLLEEVLDGRIELPEKLEERILKALNT